MNILNNITLKLKWKKYSLFSIILLLSCEKEIDLEYHQVDPIYVVEASISNSGTQVRISHTNNMDDNSTVSDIDEHHLQH